MAIRRYDVSGRSLALRGRRDRKGLGRPTRVRGPFTHIFRRPIKVEVGQTVVGNGWVGGGYVLDGSTRVSWGST